MEGFVIVLLIAIVLGAPLLALVLAVAALVRGSRIRRELFDALEDQHHEMEHLRSQLTELRSDAGRSDPPNAGPRSDLRKPKPVPPVASKAATPPSDGPGAPVAEPPPPAAPAAALSPSPLPPAASPPPPPSPPQEPPPPEPFMSRSLGLEEKLGARLFVWVGAVALALAGTLFVKYSIDQGWISPPVRITLGVLFGVALLLTGEFLRRGYRLLAQACSAAGVADLFACFLAAGNLYHLIPNPLAFALMGLTAAVGVALSLRQGPLVAVVGLIGGFFTPYWLSTGAHRPGPLFGYLLLLQVGLLAVTRLRRWWPLAGLTLLGGMVWAGLWLAFPFQREDSLWVGLFLLASVGAFLATGFVGRAAEAWGNARVPLGLGWAALGSGLGLLAALVGVGGFGTTEWVFLGILGAACLAIGRLDPTFEGTAWIAQVLTTLLLALWGANLPPDALGIYLATAGALGVLYAAGAYTCLWGAPAPGRWAALSALSALALFLVAWRTHTELAKDIHWGPPALVLALFFLVGALPVASRRRTMRGGEEALAAMAAAVTAFVSLAVPLEMEREWMAVAWATEVAALCWLAGRLRVDALAKLAWAVAAGVAIRLLLNPFVLTYPSGQTPVFNWILYGYGLPVLAFAAGAWFARREHPVLSEALQWAAAALAAALLALEVRHYFHPGRLNAPKVDLAEWGAWVVLWMALGLGLLLASRRWPLRTLDWGGRLLLLAGLAVAGLGPCLAANPAWSHHPVGETPVLNALLFVYGVPALLALLGAAELRRRDEETVSRVLGVGGVVLLFLLLTLEIRQVFRGSLLEAARATNAENYAYSAGWILFGLVLLGAGIARRSAALRYASLAVMILAIGKIFLYDLAHLEDTLLRALSFLGLGASLLFIAFLYMRFVLRRRDE